MSHARVLIVDDDCDFADSLSEALNFHGHQVTVAYSGEDALRRLENQSFDITLLDYMLPGKNGAELFTDLRGLYPEGKVMLMTGYAHQKALDKIVGNGALGVLDKPLDMDEVFEIVERASPDGTILVVDDDDDFLASTAEMLSASGHTVLTASRGQEAIDRVKEHDIDVMILDLRMPDLNGRQVYDQLQSLEKKPAVLVVTGFLEEDADSLNSLTKLSSANALIKPFDPEFLLDEVQDLMATRKSLSHS